MLGSNPITLPPNRVKLYDKKPAPQPTSMTFIPLTGFIISKLS